MSRNCGSHRLGRHVASDVSECSVPLSLVRRYIALAASVLTEEMIVSARPRFYESPHDCDEDLARLL